MWTNEEAIGLRKMRNVQGACGVPPRGSRPFVLAHPPAPAEGLFELFLRSGPPPKLALGCMMCVCHKVIEIPHSPQKRSPTTHGIAQVCERTAQSEMKLFGSGPRFKAATKIQGGDLSR